MPNPGKPNNLKSISGSRTPKVQTVDLPLVSEVPSPPDWLPNGHAVKEWERLAPILYANKLLTEAGCSALGVLCALHGKIVQLWTAGEAPTANMIGQYRSLINDFGLTPVAQGRVKMPTKGAVDNPFKANGKQRA
jgi:phage terminase small subunit